MEALGFGVIAPTPLQGSKTKAVQVRKVYGKTCDGISFQKIGKDLSSLIFSQLGIKELCRVPQVCKEWKNQSVQVHIWKEVAIRYGISTQSLIPRLPVTTNEIRAYFKDSLRTTGYLLVEALGKPGHIFQPIVEGYITALSVIPRKRGLALICGTSRGMFFAWGAKSLAEPPYYKRTIYESEAFEDKRSVDALFHFNWPNYGDKKSCIITSAVAEREYNGSLSFLEQLLNIQASRNQISVEIKHKHDICSFDSFQRGGAKMVALGTVSSIAIYRIEGDESKYVKRIAFGWPADYMKIIPFKEGREEKFVVIAASKNEPNILFFWDMDDGKDGRRIKAEGNVTGFATIEYKGKAHLASLCENGMIQIWDPASRSNVINFWVTPEAAKNATSKTWERMIAINEIVNPVLVVGNSDGEIIVFDPHVSHPDRRAVEKFVHPLQADRRGYGISGTSKITALCHVSAFSRTMIVSASMDKTIRVWEIHGAVSKARAAEIKAAEAVKAKQMSFFSGLFSGK